MPIERDGAGRLGHTAQAPRKDRIGSGGGGGGGAGTVTDITAGTGLTATPNPIIGSGTIEIAATGVTAGFYGVDAATTVSFNVNAQGQLDLASETSIQIVESQVTGLAASLAALQPLDADLTQIAAIANVRGDLLYTDATPNWARLAIGTAAKYLRSDGTDPSWQTIAYADISGTPTSLPPSGSAGGDLSGSYPNPTVVDDSHAHTAATLPAIVYDGDAAGGDLSGTYPNPSVVDDSHAHTSATVTPAGIGAQPVDADLTALAALAATAGMLSRTGAGAFTARTLTAPAAGLTIADPTGAAGNPTFALANDLAALEGLGSTGIAVRTAADTWAQRTLQAPAAGIAISNPAGVAGDPTFALANDLAAVEGLSGSGFAVRTAPDTWTLRTITVGGGLLSITDGGGAVSNPLISLDNTDIDHNVLLNLATGDVHTQYTLRAGRAGTANDTTLTTTAAGTGTLYGASTTTGVLKLCANSADLTTGTIDLDAPQIRLWPDVPSGSQPDGALLFGATLAISSGSSTSRVLKLNATYTLTGAIWAYNSLLESGTFNFNTGANIATYALFNAIPTLNINDSGAANIIPTVFSAGYTLASGNFTITEGNEFKGYSHGPTIKATGASAALTVTSVTGYRSDGTVNAVTAAGAVTIGTWRHYRVVDLTKTGSGTNTITTQVGVEIPTLAAGATNIGLRNASTRVYTPVAQSFSSAATTLVSTGSIVALTNTSGGSLTLSTTPHIANGQDGQVVTYINVGTQNIVIRDQGTFASSGLRLSAATTTLAPRDNITLMYSSTIGDWVEIAKTDVI